VAAVVHGRCGEIDGYEKKNMVLQWIDGCNDGLVDAP
jgi:hypothetical protein